MRKSRKVIADVAASPPIPPPQPPQPQAPSEEPHCLFCKQAPAKFLGYMHIPNEPTAFCCTICAATYALTYVKRRCLTWCAKHKQWSEDLNGCHRCWIETEAARRDGYIKATTASEMGVSNDA